MSDQERLERERRLRQAAIIAATRQPPEPDEEPDEPAPQEPEEDTSRTLRMEQKALWVDLQVRRAMERGDFDNLPGAGKPIRGLGGTHDPDWWVKSLIERERLTGLAPPAIALRTEDAQLEARLDRETTEAAVRRVIEDFNHRVVEARRQLLGGPPVITPTRDADQEVRAWRARRDERRRRQRERLDRLAASAPTPQRRRWWRRRSQRPSAR